MVESGCMRPPSHCPLLLPDWVAKCRMRYGPSSHPSAHSPSSPWSPHHPRDSMHDAFRQTPTCPKCGTAAHSSVRIFTTRTYERAIRKLLSEADRQAMEAAIHRRSGCLTGDPGNRRAAEVALGGLGQGKAGWNPHDLLPSRETRGDLSADRLREGGSGRPQSSGQESALAGSWPRSRRRNGTNEKRAN